MEHWHCPFFHSLTLFFILYWSTADCCCCFSLTKSWPIHLDSMDCSTPSLVCFSVLHYRPKFAQTHVHWVSDAIQPLWAPSPLAVSLSQHRGLFQWAGSSHQVAKVLELQASASVPPMNIQGWFPLGWADLILQFKVKMKVTQSRLTLCDPWTVVDGILQARILE